MLRAAKRQYRVAKQNVHCSFGDNDVVMRVNLNVANNVLVVKLGASGAGNALVLRKLNGLATEPAGEI